MKCPLARYVGTKMIEEALNSFDRYSGPER